jgi:hypothetical protein
MILLAFLLLIFVGCDGGNGSLSEAPSTLEEAPSELPTEALTTEEITTEEPTTEEVTTEMPSNEETSTEEVPTHTGDYSKPY